MRVGTTRFGTTRSWNLKKSCCLRTWFNYYLFNYLYWFHKCVIWVKLTTYNQFYGSGMHSTTIFMSFAWPFFKSCIIIMTIIIYNFSFFWIWYSISNSINRLFLYQYICNIFSETSQRIRLWYRYSKHKSWIWTPSKGTQSYWSIPRQRGKMPRGRSSIPRWRAQNLWWTNDNSPKGL